ncbi:DUF4232 domain-containing protein [Saccharopolyspora gloriosae]|uniref:DUF4232 domain-containing protein n=1 Tax=Saccharopolyspora gloriosae TaxID=455344 RepID=UPI001FB7F01A|nr:DUF4232 domain-containing protein [Saccharopolyspora gloriosae]
MTAKLRRTIAATAVAGLALGLSTLAAGSALANPSDTLCTSDDLNIEVTRDLAEPGEYEAFLVKYTAASPHTNCKLEGGSADFAFFNGADKIPGVEVQVDHTPEKPVSVDGSLFGISRILQKVDAPANPAVPTAVEFDLPGIPDGPAAHEAATWPADEPIKGDVLIATQISQSAAE